jgi:hypothetical protein
MHQPFRMDPAQRVLSDVELTGQLTSSAVKMTYHCLVAQQNRVALSGIRREACSHA